MEGFENVIFIGLAFAMGGILKGATGAGAPIVAVPMLAILYDVPLAVTLFSIPNLVPNIWQGWAFRKDLLPIQFVLLFALSGGLGAMLGTYLLSNLSSDILLLIVGLTVVAYVLFRLAHPNWVLPYGRAVTLVFPVGFVAGVLQGSSGVSAPVSITFLNAMGLKRSQFMAVISVFFVALACVQIPMLTLYGLLTPERFLLSCTALLPQIAFMPVGAYLVRHISKERFDHIILLLLIILAVKLILNSLL